jgi:cytochrome bd-type quinol oxidase subunit 2
MKPIYVAGLVLLAVTLGFALLGMVLAGFKKIRVRNAARYTQLCTILILASAYAMTHYDWPGVHLRELDFWSLMVILAIACYALIWAAVAYQLNKVGHGEFGESYMLSMLYTDSEQMPPEDFAKTKVIDKNQR